MDKPHIVHIIPTLTIGGAERVVVNLANNLVDDFQISIVLFKLEKPFANELNSKVNLSILEKKTLHGWSLYRKIQRFLSNNSVDLVHTHLFGGDFWGRLAAYQLDLPVVTTEHNLNKSESTTKHWIKNVLSSCSNLYTAPSQAVAGYMQQKYNVVEDKIEVIPHGIEVERYLHTEPYRGKQPIRLLMLGRLNKQKGHDIALKALASLNHEQYDWKLDIVGSGEEFDRITNLIKQLGLEDRVELWDATLDVVEEYQNHDMLLMPSRWEGLGLTAIEAMAAGRLVIAANVDGLAEVITHGENGLLFIPEDSQDLAKKIRYCIDNPEGAKQIASKARSHTKEKYDLSRMVDSYRAIYNNQIT